MKSSRSVGSNSSLVKFPSEMEKLRRELKGEVVHNESLRHDIKIARELIPKLENIV